MLTALSWFMFGMLVWGCCIAMQAFERRWAPSEGNKKSKGGRCWKSSFGDMGFGDMGHETKTDDTTAKELDALRERVATLEAIVTDRKYQWEQEFDASQRPRS